MKTLLTILLLVSLTAGAQNTKLKDVNPKQLCAGDTIRIDFTYNGVPGAYQFNMEGPTQNHIWSLYGSSFYSLPKQLVGTDTVYTVKLATPIWWPNGTTNVSLDWTNEVPVLFKCTITGTAELDTMVPVTPSYFDLNGQPTQPTVGELLIERRGTKFRKLIIQTNQ